ncbi:ogr/Delta-like zinc finger family protein [Enterobacter cloacae]|nr:ogr/Delta-like zinc finger family protein [Enterobacter cloacae]MCK7315671.1 ogr/Delta-like zinc finger family protein [Enterobacter cloacae]
MNCPKCGQAAHTRSSFQVSSETKERYNQCTNIECGHTFVANEILVRSVCHPQKTELHRLIRRECRSNKLTDTDPPLAGFLVPVVF